MPPNLQFEGLCCLQFTSISPLWIILFSLVFSWSHHPMKKGMWTGWVTCVAIKVSQKVNKFLVKLITHHWNDLINTSVLLLCKRSIIWGAYNNMWCLLYGGSLWILFLLFLGWLATACWFHVCMYKVRWCQWLTQ